MAFLAEWTFEGGLECISRDRRQPQPLFMWHICLYMRKSGLLVNLSGTADIIIRLKYVNLTYLGLFYLSKHLTKT